MNISPLKSWEKEIIFLMELVECPCLKHEMKKVVGRMRAWSNSIRRQKKTFLKRSWEQNNSIKNKAQWTVNNKICTKTRHRLQNWMRFMLARVLLRFHLTLQTMWLNCQFWVNYPFNYMEKSSLSVKKDVRTNYESNKCANESLKVREGKKTSLRQRT